MCIDYYVVFVLLHDFSLNIYYPNLPLFGNLLGNDSLAQASVFPGVYKQAYD